MPGVRVSAPTSVAVVVSLVLLSSPAYPAGPMLQGKSIRQYVHQVWTSANGMPQNSAQDIVQTRDGYIWFATQEGLTRFDGNRFTVFDRMNVPRFRTSFIDALDVDSADGLWLQPSTSRLGAIRMYHGDFTFFDTSNGLPSNNVRIGLPGGGDTEWLGTDRGLVKIVGGKVRAVYRSADGLPSDVVTGLGRDVSGCLWIATTRGVAKTTGSGVAALPAFRDSAIAGPRIRTQSDGTVWIPTSSCLFALHDGRMQRFDATIGFRGRDLHWITETRNGGLWFGTRKGLFHFDRGRFLPFPLPADPDVRNVLQITEDREGALWLVTGKGLARISGGNAELYQQKDGLSDNAINKLFIDNEGSVWVGTNSGGVDRFRDEKFVTYSTQTGLSYDMIQPVLEDSRGVLWVGTSFGGVNRIEGGTIAVYDTRRGLPSNDVFGLSEDRDGTLWIACSLGLASVKDGKVTLRQANPDGQNISSTSPVFQTRDGRRFALRGLSVLQYSEGRFDTVAVLGDVPLTPRSFLRELYEDSRGTFWVASIDQLYRYEGSRLIPVGTDVGLPAGWVQAFHETPDGALWFGVSGTGLVRFRDGRFTPVTPAQGLFDFNAYTILDDGRGSAWMSSNKGVYHARWQDLNDVADGKKPSLACISYGEADGMGSRECNGGYLPSGARLKDGRLAFPTVRGLAVVNPADIRVNTVPPPVALERFLVDGQPQPLDTMVTLEPGRQRFEFQYTGISFAGAAMVHFKYMLEGLDKDWVDAGTRREAFFTHLDPGTYRFHVLAANSDGVWNEAGAAVSFRLRPFFYQSGWFIGLAVLFFLTSGPTFYYFRMRRVNRRKAELEQQVGERTAELQKTVQNLKETQHQLILSEKMASLGQLTAGIAHEIKNPLNFITNFAVLSHDLVRDLRAELTSARQRVEPERAREIGELLDDLEQNVGKINEHGRRADSIVRGMLLHSRGKPGERQETDLNALLAEYTTLAYHGMRAQDQTFNVRIETGFDPAVGKVRVVPQDLSRAFLNIVNNACYAANDRRKTAGEGFAPAVHVSTRADGPCVEIRIRDNGSGIPQAIRDKIFNPFFTTKPPGVGTGLGLSLTYDIVTGEHKGQLAVDTREGEFTEFVITLPRYPAEEGGKAA